VRVLTVTRSEDIVVTLTRPERLNALNTELAQSLIAAGRDCRRCECPRRDSHRCWTGILRRRRLDAGRTRQRRGMLVGRDTSERTREGFNPVNETWALLPKPVFVAQNGVAAGGGVGLALCGDYILMAESASYLLVFVPKLGLVPDMGVSSLLPRAIGAVRAACLALRGTPISSGDAHAFGLAHAVVGDDVLQSRARQLASELALAPPGALAAAEALMGPRAASPAVG
jgi:2-(1,2-epoxy-1,2-dihydrophenyl)acetyl-CoA isomerase